MLRRHLVSRSALLIAMGALPSPLLPRPAAAQAPGEPIVTIRDAETESLLHGFASPLFRVAGVNAGLVRMTLVRDRALNAFVSTGNRMFINTGLIQQADGALDVIGPLAHETGHVAHGDISRLPEEALAAMIQGLGSLLIGAAAGVASRNPGVAAGAILGGQSMAQRRFMSFSRTQEESADISALAYLERLGWSARGMMNTFARLEAQDALIVNRRDPYLLTHPMSRERFQRVERFVAESRVRDTGQTDRFEPSFRMVKAKLEGYLNTATFVQRTYPGTDPSPEARYAQAVLNQRMGHRDQALYILDTLIREQPTNPWIQELKGQVLLESGQARTAVAFYQQAARFAPDQPLIRQGLGHAMIESGDGTLTKQAIAQLQMAQSVERNDPTTWHLLGIAWGRVGNVGEANLALAEEAMLYNNLPVARRFARQAADSLPAGPSRLRALDITNAVKKENRS